jgi:hypothetical protein
VFGGKSGKAEELKSLRAEELKSGRAEIKTKILLTFSRKSGILLLCISTRSH